MSSRISSIKDIGVIKAYRGEQLKIKLGKPYTGGTLTAWMKKDANDLTHRTFEFNVDNSVMTMTKEKCSDYYIGADISETVEGRWRFDVEYLADGEPADQVKTILTGQIIFTNDITNSGGGSSVDVEGNVSSVPIYTLSPLAVNEFSLMSDGVAVSTVDLSSLDGGVGSSSFLELTDTPSSFGAAGHMAVVNAGSTGLEFTPPPVDTDTYKIFVDAISPYIDDNDKGDAEKMLVVDETGEFVELVDRPKLINEYESNQEVRDPYTIPWDTKSTIDLMFTDTVTVTDNQLTQGTRTDEVMMCYLDFNGQAVTLPSDWITAIQKTVPIGNLSGRNLFIVHRYGTAGLSISVNQTV